MTLKEYLTVKKISFRAFSKKVNVDAAHLCRLAGGTHMPSMETALKIYLASDRKVSFLSWFQDES